MALPENNSQQNPSLIQEEIPCSETEEQKWSSWTKVIEIASKYDLIEIQRGLYQHWVLYLGEGNIIHTTQVNGRTEGFLAEKRVDKLSVIVRNDKCRINNHEEYASLNGLKVQSAEDIFQSISDVLVQGFYIVVPYYVSTLNCEHYSTSWKYGTGFSLQIPKAIANNIPPEMIHESMQLAQDIQEQKADHDD